MQSSPNSPVSPDRVEQYVDPTSYSFVQRQDRLEEVLSQMNTRQQSMERILEQILHHPSMAGEGQRRSASMGEPEATGTIISRGANPDGYRRTVAPTREAADI